MNAKPILKVITTGISNYDRAIATRDIELKLESLRDIKRKIAMYEEQEKVLQEDLKIYMGCNEELKNKEGLTLATWKVSITKSLDQKKLKESGLDLEGFYVEKQKRIFLIK
jgi:predicted phage-related endonuclease